jgi:hypothetical protein
MPCPGIRLGRYPRTPAPMRFIVYECPIIWNTGEIRYAPIRHPEPRLASNVNERRGVRWGRLGRSSGNEGPQERIAMLRGVLLGAVAGAAGNLTLEIVTYGDMLLRGRAASGVPAKMIAILADDFGIEALASAATGNQADNRRSAAGALLGYALGVGLGGTYGLVRPILGRVSTPLAGVAVGLAAMTAADASYAVTGASDPKTWTMADWISDLVPHVLYGLVTVATYEVIARCDVPR